MVDKSLTLFAVLAVALSGVASTGVSLLDGGRVLVNANRFGVKDRLFAGAVVSNDFTLTTRRTAHCVLAKAVLPEAVEPRLQIDYAHGFGPDATVTVRVREWQTVEGEIATPTGTVYFTSVFSSYPARYGLFDGAHEPHTFTHEIRAKGCVGYFHENYYSSAGDTLQVRTGFSDRGVAEAAAFLAAEMPSFDEPAPKFIGLRPDANDPLPERAFVMDNPTAANIQRTMAKLEASTAENPATVRILFYGQSITFQLWSARVIEDLKRRYPTVNFIVRNEAIGGYGTDMLFQTMETDIFPFYPDLLVFHDYGDPRDGYLRILNEVRRRTTAEIVLCSSHLRGDETATNIVALLASEQKPGKWDRDAMAADRTVKIRSVSEDLGTMFVDLQGKWCRALIDNGWESKKLLRDGVHLNPLGIAYYSAFYADELVRRPELKPGEMSGSICEEPFATRLEFTGNRVAAVSDGTGDPDATAEVWLDGKKVGDAATLRMWGMTRPSAVINWFPGLVGASFERLPVDEFWTLTILPDDPKDEEQTLSVFYRRKKPPVIKPIRYRIEGTVTGFDGEGSSARDFVSKSGRVKIPADAFLDFYEWPKLRPPAGTRILWRTYPLFAETYRARPRGVETVLVQGCANERHVLELRNARGRLGIARFVVNEPTHRELPQTSLVVTVRPGEDLRAVRDSVRRNRAADEPAEVILEDGVYEVKDELVLDSPRDARTTWRAKNPGKAVFVGGPTVSGSAFRPVTNAAILARLPAAARGKVRALPVPERIRGNFRKGALGRICGAQNGRVFRRPKTPVAADDTCLPVLTVDTKFMMPAAWPNGEKFLWTDAEKGDPRIARWNWSDADIYTWGFHGRAFDYRTQRLSVGWNAASNTVDFGKAKVGKTARYRFINVLEELDAPGEWCYHAPSGTVLLYPPEGFGPSSRCSLGTFRDHFFAVRAEDVTLDGLVFTAKPGYQAVAVDSCRGARVTNCRFSGIDGHAAYLDGTENVIRDCTFEDITSSAVHVRGGDPKTLTAASNVVENCRLRHLNFLEDGMFHAAIRMYGCGHYVRHNEIEDTMEQAIGFHARNSVVEYNRCRDCCKEYGDANVIGTGGPYAPGSVIRYNDVGGCAGFTEGIYIDDCASDVTVYGNVIHDVGHFGIFLGGGQRNVISNNVVIGGWGGIHTDNRGITWPQWKKTRDEKGLYALAPVNSVFVNNLIYDNSGYGSHLGLSKKLFPPDGANVFTGNLVVRPVGLRPGCSDIQSGESANAPTNRFTATTTNRTDRPIGPVRILDGTPENPIDIGFRHIPKPAFEPRGYMLESFAWVDVDRLTELRAADALGRQTDTGDYSLKPDARLLNEIPGFEPIPWEKIGNRGYQFDCLECETFR